MIFLAVMPILIGGFGNYFIPILIGCREMAWPRINGLSFWLLPVSLFLILISSIIDNGIGTGWTLYPPLSTKGEIGRSVEYGILGLHITRNKFFIKFNKYDNNNSKYEEITL